MKYTIKKSRKLVELDPNRKLTITPYPYYVRKSMEEGEKDLVLLSQTAQYEQPFMFIEDLGVWRYSPQNSKVFSKDGKIFMQIQPKILHRPEFESIVSYHIHPLSATLLREPTSENISRGFAGLSIPSIDDLITTSYTPENYTSKVVSPLGVTEYEAFSKAIKVFDPEKYYELVRNLLTLYMDKDKELTVEKTIEKLNEKLEGLAKMEFRNERSL